MDPQAVIQTVIAALAIALIGWIGRLLLKRLTALEEVAVAQLTENGGGSLVDKVNKTWAAVPILQETVDANHKEARGRWQSLDRLEGEIRELKDGRDAMQLDITAIKGDVKEFKRGQRFFARFGPALLALEPEDRRSAITALAERIAAEVDDDE